MANGGNRQDQSKAGAESSNAADDFSQSGLLYEIGKQQQSQQREDYSERRKPAIASAPLSRITYRFGAGHRVTVPHGFSYLATNVPEEDFSPFGLGAHAQGS